MDIAELHNFLKRGKVNDLGLIVVLKLKVGLIPNLDDFIELLLNVGLSLGSLDELTDIVSELVEFETNDVVEAELGRLEINILLANDHESPPVTLLHVLGTQLLDHWSNHIHLLDSVVQGAECIVAPDVLVLVQVWSSLLGLDILQERGNALSIDVVPQGLLPGIKLQVNQGNQIPHLLE